MSEHQQSDEGRQINPDGLFNPQKRGIPTPGGGPSMPQRRESDDSENLGIFGHNDGGNLRWLRDLPNNQPRQEDK